MSICLMSYNVHGGVGLDGERNYARIGRLFDRHDVDIALVQEFECRPSRGGSLKDVDDLRGGHFENVATGATMKEEGGWYGNMILSRFPIVGPAIHDISIGRREKRNILDARIKTPRHGVIRVLNTHFGLSFAERVQQSLKVLHIVEKEHDDGLPMILAGDINEWRPYAGIIRTLNQILRNVPCGGTFPTALPRVHLDRIWCMPGNLIESAAPLRTPETRKLSDHLPIIARVPG